jgi:hypothetical protein
LGFFNSRNSTSRKVSFWMVLLSDNSLRVTNLSIDHFLSLLQQNPFCLDSVGPGNSLRFFENRSLADCQLLLETCEFELTGLASPVDKRYYACGLRSITVVPANLSKYLRNLLSLSLIPMAKSNGSRKAFPKFLTAA